MHIKLSFWTQRMHPNWYRSFHWVCLHSSQDKFSGNTLRGPCLRCTANQIASQTLPCGWCYDTKAKNLKYIALECVFIYTLSKLPYVSIGNSNILWILACSYVFPNQQEFSVDILVTKVVCGSWFHIIPQQTHITYDLLWFHILID